MYVVASEPIYSTAIGVGRVLFAGLRTKRSATGLRFEGLMNNDDMEVSKMYCQVIHLAHKLCSSYTIFCPHCMVAGHFSFQCSHTYNESLVSYENGDATSEVLEYVLYKGAH